MIVKIKNLYTSLSQINTQIKNFINLFYIKSLEMANPEPKTEPSKPEQIKIKKIKKN